MNIKAITLDLDDTLWPIWPTIREAEETLLAWLRANAPRAAEVTSAEKIRQIRNQVEAEHPEQKHDLSWYRLESIRRLLAQAGENKTLADHAFDVYLAARQNVKLFDDALPALKRLSARYPLIAVTNGNADIKSIGIHEYFKDTVTAKQMRTTKPDIRLFQQAQTLLGYPPSEILHVGDDLHSDVFGALNAGMQAAWIQRDLPLPQQQTIAHQPHYIAQDLLALCDQLGLYSQAP